MGWFDRWRGADFDAVTAPKLARPAQTAVRWIADGAGGLVSADGYWHVRKVTTFHLERQGVDLGPWPDLEQAQARAELDDQVRAVCRGSEGDYWRLDVESQHGECLVCGAWCPVKDGKVVAHPSFDERHRRP